MLINSVIIELHEIQPEEQKLLDFFVRELEKGRHRRSRLSRGVCGQALLPVHDLHLKVNNLTRERTPASGGASCVVGANGSVSGSAELCC